MSLQPDSRAICYVIGPLPQGLSVKYEFTPIHQGLITCKVGGLFFYYELLGVERF